MHATENRQTPFRLSPRQRTMPRRRIDIATEAIDYKNPDLLRKIRNREREDFAASRRPGCRRTCTARSRAKSSAVRSVLLMK
jgi:hypothetical protein